MKINVTRAFLLGGQVYAVGTSLEVPDLVARELIHSGKAQVAAGSPPAAPPGPMTTKTAAAVVKGKAAEGPAP